MGEIKMMTQVMSTMIQFVLPTPYTSLSDVAFALEKYSKCKDGVAYEDE